MSKRKNDERRDTEKKKQKKKRRDDSNTLESKTANIKVEVRESTGAGHCNGNVNKNIEKAKMKKKSTVDKTVGGSSHRLEENVFEDSEDNVLSTYKTCGNVIQHEKEVETTDGDSSGHLVGKVGKKINREKNKGGASEQYHTQLTESGKQNSENQNGKRLENLMRNGRC